MTDLPKPAAARAPGAAAVSTELADVGPLLAERRAERGAAARRVAAVNWRFWLALVAALGLWELLSHTLDQPLVLAPLENIARKAGQEWSAGSLQQGIVTSFIEFAAGFAIAAVVGTVVGLLAGYYARIGSVVKPFLSAVQAMPVIGLGPIFIVAFGIGMSSKIAIVALNVFFPVALNVCAGVRETSEALYDLGKCFGYGSAKRLTKIALPSSVPYIIAGYNVGIGRGLTAVVAGELFGAVHGLGLQIFTASSSFDTASVYVAVIIFAVEGVILSKLLEIAGRRIAPWQHTAKK
jgi:ABC-type nitrate/sulfonate/bicarbonate transport system permease component